MRFGFHEDQQEYARLVRKLFEARATLADVRTSMATEQGFDREVWQQLADQLGVQGLAVPERFGGSGQSFLELGVVLHEAGRALSSLPLLGSTVLATTALLESGDEAAQERWLPGLASGALVGTLAVASLAGSWDLAAPGVTAVRGEGGFLLDGSKGFVLHGHAADLLLITATTDEGLGLFAVEATAPGLTRARVVTLDPTRAQAVLELAGTPALAVGRPGRVAQGLDRTLQLASIALAQEQVGAAQRCLDMAVGYAKTREQFGRPIGSFQAVKHICADVLLEVESARAAADYAAWAAATSAAELPVVASLAKAFCSETLYLAAAQNIQVHGGIGFTWEHDAHLFLKRAVTSSEYLGSVPQHRERLASLVLPR